LSGRPAVFLDRDGTLVREVDFLVHPDELELLPGAAEAVADLARAGFAVVLVTNQSGVARGYLDEARLAEIHVRLAELLAEHGAHLDLVLYCPHHPDHGGPEHRRACDCRKPAPGMTLEAIRRLDLDPAASWTIGDSLRDAQAGLAAGTRAILVRTGKGEAQAPLLADAGLEVAVAADLAEAARTVLAGARQGR
jgi:D-glycero-D-manno-heptose 1,7-bisphosphate phosphatase